MLREPERPEHVISVVEKRCDDSDHAMMRATTLSAEYAMSKQSRIREKDPGVFHDSNESLCLCECEVRIMICAPGLLGYVRSKLFVCMKYDVDFLGKDRMYQETCEGRVTEKDEESTPDAHTYQGSPDQNPICPGVLLGRYYRII